MYADFIEDKLAANSEYIRLLKLGLKKFQPDWLESNFRAIVKREEFQKIDALFDNLKEQFTDEEKLFIYRSVYGQAGFRESLLTLGNFITGLAIGISDLDDGSVKPERKPVSYRPPLKFVWNSSDQCYKSTSVYTQSEFSYTAIGFRHLIGDQYQEAQALTTTDQIFRLSNPQESTVKITSEVRDNATVLLFNGSPYLNTVVPLHSYCEFYREGTTNPVLTLSAKWGTLSSLITKDTYVTDLLDGQEMYYVPWNTGTIPTSLKYVPAEDLMYVKMSSFTSGQDFIMLKPYNGTTSTNNNLVSYSFPVEDTIPETLGFTFYPYCFLSNGSSSRQLPALDNNTIFTYQLNITTTGEIFNDYDLMKSQLTELMHELLFYKGATDYISFPKITFDQCIVNSNTASLNIAPKVFRFITVTEPETTSAVSSPTAAIAMLSAAKDPTVVVASDTPIEGFVV